MSEPKNALRYPGGEWRVESVRLDPTAAARGAARQPRFGVDDG